jgi:hypothetical protein
MDEIYKELVKNAPKYEDGPPGPLSPYYYKRLHDGTLFTQTPYPEVDIDRIHDFVQDFSPMEKGLILVGFIGVWAAVGLVRWKISLTVKKLATSHLLP